MKKTAALIIILVVLFGGILYSETDKKEIRVFADMTDIPYGNKDKNVALKGNVRILHDDVTIKSDYVEYNSSAKTAVSPGRVTLSSPEADIISDKGSGNFRTRIVTAESNVSARIHRRFTEKISDPEKRADVEKEITEDIIVKADGGQYNYKDKLLTCRGNITITEKDRVILADSLTYNVRDEVFTLEGNVKGTDSEGQTFASPGPVTVSVKDGNEYIKAPNAGISFFVDDEEDGEE
ncbi:MAG: LPS export ABC transporter periplasmic protein LptC [Abditibacteriota bacterium]|nr:LPS export ABC transporter periplasmic protein LptC [Abditibacteriota bacterium]